MTDPDLALASLFPVGTRDAWQELVSGVLKGSDFDRTLVGRTDDGIRIEPLYAKAESGGLPSRIRHAAWGVCQRVDHPEPGEANALALQDLENGADALTLVFAGSPSGRGFGLPVDDVDALDRALHGVMLDLISVRLDAGRHGREAALVMADLAESRGHRLAELKIDFALDPVGTMAAEGHLSAEWNIVAGRLGEMAVKLGARGLSGGLCLADGRPYHDAGASEAQELAAIVSTGLAYLRALEAGGTALEAADPMVSFLAVSDADEFMSVAKPRALRRLWAEVQAACGLPARPIRLHAETAWRMTTQRDPWVNILRGTLAAFSAGIGGADTITVLPFTSALGLPDAFARRIARNTQLVLTEEANLWRVDDPVAGSGGFEAMTDGLVEAGWAAFQEIEREGGIVPSLSDGLFQRRIADVAARRGAAVATRRKPLTGTSEFPNLRERPVTVLMPAVPPAVPAPIEGGVTIQSLLSTRLAEPFERLRDVSDRRLADTGGRPLVFLANLGPPAAFSARATFARNTFEAGGIEAVGDDGFASPNALVAAFRASRARLACLCSSDAIYAREAVSAAAALNAAGAAALYLAGRPGDLAEPLASAGVTRFVYVGCDVLAVLQEAMRLA